MAIHLRHADSQELEIGDEVTCLHHPCKAEIFTIHQSIVVTGDGCKILPATDAQGSYLKQRQNRAEKHLLVHLVAEHQAPFFTLFPIRTDDFAFKRCFISSQLQRSFQVQKTRKLRPKQQYKYIRDNIPLRQCLRSTWHQQMCS